MSPRIGRFAGACKRPEAHFSRATRCARIGVRAVEGGPWDRGLFPQTAWYAGSAGIDRGVLTNPAAETSRPGRDGCGRPAPRCRFCVTQEQDTDRLSGAMPRLCANKRAWSAPPARTRPPGPARHGFRRLRADADDQHAGAARLTLDDTGGFFRFTGEKRRSEVAKPGEARFAARGWRDHRRPLCSLRPGPPGPRCDRRERRDWVVVNFGAPIATAHAAMVTLGG